MGPGISRVPDSIYASSDAFSAYHENIFQSASDEIAFSREFTSNLFSQKKNEVVKPLVLPDANLICDVVTRPFAFTQFETPTQTWQQLLAQLFTNSENSMPHMYQILYEFSVFLKQRPDNIFFQEDENRKQKDKRTDKENAEILQALNKSTLQPKIDTEKLNSIITKVDLFLNSLPKTMSKEFNYNPQYLSISEFFIKRLPTPNYSFPLLMWGLTCGDLSDVVCSLTHLTGSVMKKEAIQHEIEMKYYAEKIPLLPMNNATSLPFSKSVIASTAIPGTTPKDVLAAQNIACDGRSLLVLQENGILRRINLGDTYINLQARFTTIDTNINAKEAGKLSIVSCNGYLVISGSLMNNPKLFKTNPFKLEKSLKCESFNLFWTSPKLTTTSITDGEFIYCCSNKKVMVWSLKSQYLAFKREIELYQNGTTLLAPFDKKVCIKDWEECSVQYVSGNTYNFLICLSSEPNNIKYFARSFSLSDGRHICDTIFSSKFPILSIVSDPWNRCLWATTSASNGLLLVKMHMLGSKQQWLTGVPLSIMPTVDDVKQAFCGEQTLAGAANAASLFIQYISTMFAGTEQNAVLHSENYCADISNFVCPCSEKMIISLVEALTFFKKIYMRPEKSCPFQTSHLQRIITSLLSLLQVNLSNLYRRKMSEIMEQDTLRKVSDVLIDIFDHSQFEFAMKTTSYVFITAFPLIFDGQNARSASVFKRIYDKMSPDFIFAALRIIQNDHFFSHCFTASSCRDTIGPILDLLIDSPNDLSQGQRELLTLFQRNMMIEMRKMYEENPGELPPIQDQLQATFFAYAKLITEKFIYFLEINKDYFHEKYVKENKFVSLFRKWLILLQPLSKYSRVSKELVSMLHPVFILLSKKIQDEKPDGDYYSKDHKSFLVVYSLFFEVFIVFIEFIMSLLEGGNELDNANNYLWLVHSTLNSGITNQNFHEIAEKMLDQKTSKEERVKIISERSQCKEESLDMLADAFDEKNFDELSELVSLFYNRKFKQVFNKTGCKSMTINDIFTVFAVSKQLDVMDELSLIRKQLKNKEDIQFSYKMKSVMQIVTESRKAQILRRQRVAGKDEAEDKSSEKEFDEYLKELQNKLVFLLLIKPCRSIPAEDVAFSNQVKSLERFITEEIKVDRCLELVKGAEMVKKNISLGVSIITEIIDKGFNQTLVCFLLDKIVKSQHFMKYLMCVKLIEKESEIKLAPGNMPKLLSLLVSLLEKSKEPALSNLLIVLYSNLVLTLGNVDISQIFEPISRIIKVLFGPEHINSIDKKYMQSYGSLIVSCMYAAIKDSNAIIDEESLDNIAKLIFTTPAINVERLAIANLCLSCGMKVPYTDDAILHFIKTASPLSYHNIFEFLTEYISRGKNKVFMIYSLLGEISNVVSGGKPQFMSDCPMLTRIAHSSSSKAQTPGVFFIGCSGMIQVIRHCLSIECEAKEQITKIFNFILDFSASHRSLPVSDEMKPFVARKFLFGVFAVLSNVIDIPSNNSLIKNTNTNCTYYATKVDMKNQCYYGWKIPITSTSSEEKIDFSSSIVAKSLLPFQPSMFPDHSHLIPFFKSAFLDKPTSYSRETLVFYILSCLSEYCNDPKFLSTLFNTGITFELSRLSVHDYSHDFMNILRVHLSTPSNGFWVPPSTSPRLSYCSMGGVFDNIAVNITDHDIVVNRGAQSFVSDPLDPISTTYLHMEFHLKCEFEVGVHFISLHASTSETFLFKSDGIALYNGCDIDTVPDLISYTTMTLAYDPTNQKLHIYDGSKLIFTYNTSKGVAAFILHTFGPSDISYSLGPSSPESIPMNYSSVSHLCPVAGKTVFKKRKMKINESLDETLRTYPCVQSNEQPITPLRPSFQTLVEQRDEFIFNWEAKPNPIVSYPASIIKACGHTLNISAASHIKQQILTFPSAQLNHTSNAGTHSPTPICVELVNKGGNLVGAFPLCVDPVFVNDNTGEISPINDAQTKQVFTFQPLHPSTYPILPAEILNFFATGYVNQTRRESQSQIFLHAISTPDIGVKRAIEVFNLDLPNLVEYTLTLIMHIEPINAHLIAENECPIDFGVNVLSKMHHTTGPHYIYKQALDLIFSYIAEEKLETEVVEIWNHLLYQQFSDCGMHFVKRGQPHAIISQLVALAEPREIYEPHASGFVVFRTGFNGEGEVCIKEENKVIKFEKGLIYVKGNSLTLLHGDAEGDGVVALPIVNASNETLFGSFFELIVSLKYFSLFLSRHTNSIDHKVFKEARSDVYIRFIDSFIVHSPFFSIFGSNILEFLNSVIPLTCLEGEVVVRISILAVYADKQKNPIIKQFLIDQETMWKERIYLPLKKFFPEFLNEDEKAQLIDVSDKWEVPEINFPCKLSKKESYNTFSAQLMRLMRQRRELCGFPFHIILKEWAKYASKYPAFTISKINEEEMKVTVTTKMNENHKIKIIGDNTFNKSAMMKDDEAGEYTAIEEIDSSVKTFFIKCDCEKEKMNKISFFLKCEDDVDLHTFIEDNREMFVSDVSRLFYEFDELTNKELVKMLKFDQFTADELELSIKDSLLLECGVDLPKHIVSIRLLLLHAINWLLYNERFRGPDSSIRHMCRFMPYQLKFRRFIKLIDDKSNDDEATFKIDRIKACDVRDGTSTDLNQTFIMQFAKIYNVPKRFRKRGNKPFRIKFIQELGNDDGGISKEFILEAVKDITLPTSGLFVPVPNALNKENQNADTFIPIPSSRISNPHVLYKAIGVILGICIRSEIVKDIPFAPFIWEYLATGKLRIEDIYSIDSNYKALISSLESVLDMKMSEALFKEHFNLTFVVKNSLGSEIALTELGRTKPVTIANCKEYISLSNDFRIAEIRENLCSMREGLWENLDLKPPLFVDGKLIHYSCCGDTILTVDDLLKHTEFNNTVPPTAKKMLIQVLQSFTSEQLTMFLKFSTALEKLPTQQTSKPVLTICYSRGVQNKCPTAATCFSQLYIPQYTSYEIARNMILKAISYTGTFENK